jgi:hypothetical protein
MHASLPAGHFTTSAPRRRSSYTHSGLVRDPSSRPLFPSIRTIAPSVTSAGREEFSSPKFFPTWALKGDVSDFLDAGGTVEQLRELADVAPEWFPGRRSRRT